MQKFALLTATILIAFVSCSKQHNDTPLTPTEALLIGSPWVLQRSDTIHYNSANIVTSRQTYIPSGCSSQPHYVFYTGGAIQMYVGCTQPSFDPSASHDFSWHSGVTYISWDLSGSPRGGPISSGSDSIITLTKDTLVLGARIDSGANKYQLNGMVWQADHPRFIEDWFTH